ncbi:MAG: NTP transferase domain-containing protein [Candidatus Nomurabacteria bacterium]|jgi:mannose-1-phosphate guanylyltransferase/mannose-6-phosphate isomerase|nr:NTP transferase domain-containing protein [Candidatus Nomurabacteria bacterium]
MIIVILAGGVGTRLWPLSTPETPKYLLKLNGEKTMIQQTFERNKLITTADKIFVITDQKNAPKVAEQLPELAAGHLLPIPADRGTAVSIVMALDAISREYADRDEPIAFVHADHAISDVDGYVRSFGIAQTATVEHRTITLVGIHPTYPATGFGYIEKGEPVGEVFEVLSFKEKPDFATAEEYLESGKFVWNAGYFIGSLNTFLATIEADAPDLQKTWETFSQIGEVLGEEYNAKFLEQPSDQIDFALMEKAKKLLVAPAEFDWSDIGSFKDLHEILPIDEDGNHAEGAKVYLDGATNVYVRNDYGMTPVVVIGVDNIAVVNTPNGILIARRDLSKNIGEIAKKINKERSGV